VSLSGFIVGAALLALLAVACIALPLLAPRAGQPRAALAALGATLLVVAGSASLYLLRSNASWREQPPVASSRIAGLVERVGRDPADRAAWLELGSEYTQAEQLALALRAYDRANTLAGGNDAAALTGMGEALLLTGDETRVATARGLLERALQADPHAAKALFYSALLAMKAGELQLARDRFSALLALNPPEHVRTALTGQIATIDRMLHPPVDRATLIDLQIDVAPELRARVPAAGALFVFVRNPAGGPPLAVRRLPATLPAHVQLSAADSMLGPSAIAAGQQVRVVARLSAAGRPTADSGDLYGELSYRAGKDSTRNLAIDRASP
jgi:cytochrome c-type biogenesis protein CcmH